MQLKPIVLAWPLLVTTGAVLLLLLLLSLLIKNFVKAGFIATPVVLVVFGFDHFPKVYWIKGQVLVLLFSAVFLFVIIKAIRTSRDLAKISVGLNLVAAGLVAVNLSIIISHLSKQARLNKTAESTQGAEVGKVSVKPDIYFIVPDRYANNKVWQEQFNFNNEEFLGPLRDRGFKVYDNAYSNYQVTTQSLASTLNLRYLDQEAKTFHGKSSDLVPLYDLIGQNQVVKTLKSVGYKYVHIGSWWAPTATSDLADLSYSKAIAYTVFNLTFTPSEYSRLVIRKSLAQVFLRRGIYIKGITVVAANVVDEDVHANAFHYQLASLKRAAHQPGPKFVFVHFLMPHPPFVFAANGQRLPETKGGTHRAVLYIDQLKYTNQKLLEAIDHIKSASKRPTAILIQSDEGPFPGEGRKDAAGPGDNAQLFSAADLQMKFGVIRAVSLPDLEAANYPGELASVNLFRFLFNHYFKTNLELLPDRSWVFPNQSDPYNFVDKTEQIKS